MNLIGIFIIVGVGVVGLICIILALLWKPKQFIPQQPVMQAQQIYQQQPIQQQSQPPQQNNNDDSYY